MRTIINMSSKDAERGFRGNTVAEKYMLKKSIQVRHTLYTYVMKRIIDFVLALLALILLSPVILILAVIVRCKLGKPIFFRQKRPGYHEEIFELIKFRTMTEARDQNGELLPDEQRITKFGKWLRATSLDELPELWNIVRGDMALVGPRPLLVQYLPLYNEVQRHRHDVKPGFTGYAQVHGRNAISWEKKFQYDVWYVQNISFSLDVKIIIDTIKVVLKKEGISSQTSATMEVFMGSSKKDVESGS